MLARVESCKVLFSAGKRLQPIPAAGKRDHMPLQCVFRHKLAFESAQPTFMWDRHALAQGVLHGHRHDQLLQACEGRLAEFDLHAHCHSTPDTLWHIINTAVIDAAQVCYTQQKKHTSDPIDTQEAHAAMVDMRSHLVSLHKPVRLSHAGHSGFSLDFLSALLQQWKGLVAYWKARRQLDQLAKRDGQTRLAKQLGVFNGAWQRRQFAEMWKVARRLSGKNPGPKQRVYSKPITERPCIDEGQLTWHVLAKTVAGTLNGSLSSQIVNRMQFLKTGKFFIWHNQTSMALLSSTRPPRHGLPQLKSGGNCFFRSIIRVSCDVNVACLFYPRYVIRSLDATTCFINS